MASVQQLFKSLEQSLRSDKERTHCNHKVSSSCYETVLNFQSQSSFSQHLSSKASDYAFLASKYGFTDRAERLYDCVDTIMDGKETKQHHLDALAILLQLSESRSSPFNPIHNNKDDNLFALNDMSYASLDTSASRHSTSINDLHSLFSAIPSNTQSTTHNQEITTDNQDDNLWISDETNDFNFVSPFASIMSYSLTNSNDTAMSLLRTSDEHETDTNLMGVGLYDKDDRFVGNSLSFVRSSDHNHTIIDTSASVYDADTICSFRHEWKCMKSKWTQLEDEQLTIETDNAFAPPPPSDGHISCSYFNGSPPQTKHKSDEDYLLSEHQLNLYHKRYLFSRTVPHKARFVRSSEVISSILNALLGIADNTRVICSNPKCNEFFPMECFCKGVSVESMNDILHNVCGMATKYNRLKQFANNNDDAKQKSFITQCLRFAVNEYLHFYAECVLSLPSSIEKEYRTLLGSSAAAHDLHLVDIMCHMSKWNQSITFLYDLCRSVRGMSSVNTLQFLYESISKSIDNAHRLAIYLFEHCCAPLMDIISSWIYCGQISKDVYHEITSTNKSHDEVRFDKLPLFLNALRSDIERTGYALNILKRCDYTLFCCCFVPNFFDETETINYPLRVVFRHDEIKFNSKRQKTLFKLQMSLFEDMRHTFYDKERAQKECIYAENKKQIQIWKAKKENEDDAMEKQREEIKKKQKEMRLTLQRTIHDKRSKKKKAKRERMAREREELLQMEMDEEEEIKAQKRMIKEEIQRVDAERRHNALLMEWKVKRAELNPKRRNLICELDDKYLKEFEELKQQQKDDHNVVQQPVDDVNATATTLTQQTLLQFDESFQALTETDSILIPLEDEDDDDDDEDMKMAEIETEIKCEIEFEEVESTTESKESIKYKAKRFETEFVFTANDEKKRYEAFIADDCEAFIPHCECIKQSIFGGIQCQSFLVDKVSLFLFMDRLKLLHHFESFHRFYLMNSGVGDLMNRLCHNLYIKKERDGARAVGYEWMNLIFCEICESDPFAQRLKFIPSRFNSKEVQLLREMVGDPCFLSDLFLDYHIEWPLTEIITHKMMISYNLILIFFLYLHHVQWQLMQCWNEMKRWNGHKSDSLLIKHGISWHTLQIFRRECHLIIDNLMSFFNNQILNISWNRFKNEVQQIHQNNGNILGIKRAHAQYVQHLLESCFLNPHQSDLRKRIHKMLQLMMEFQKNTHRLVILLEHDSSYNDGNYNYIKNRNIDNVIRNIVKCMQSFQSVAKFVFKILDGLNKRRVSHVIHSLLIQLDFNSYYNNKTTKSNFI